MKRSYYSHGKLLLTGEYAVLDGAKCLALPTRKGQSLDISPLDGAGIVWKSFDHDNKIWFETYIRAGELSPEHPGKEDNAVRSQLLRLLIETQRMNPKFPDPDLGYLVETRLEFSRDWGLGSSSTLINNLAQWAGVNAYELHQKAFGGSGYDIACAGQQGPLFFKRTPHGPEVSEVAFDPPFKEHLYFVHLNKKKDSREGIREYRKRSGKTSRFIREISRLSEFVAHAQTLEEFAGYLDIHENLVASQLGVPSIKDLLFPEFKGSVKSLGAWGGDFILAIGGADTTSYFKNKGYLTVVPYPDMVL